MRYLLAIGLSALLMPLASASQTTLTAPDKPVLVADAAGAAAKDAPASVSSFIANTTSIAPGQTFLLGVELTVQPGWHIYAADPGQIGKPTSIKLALPPGFSSGTPRWPQHLVKQEDGFTINAHEGKVFVIIPVTAPSADKMPSGPLTIGADVDWLGCKDNCVPGRQHVELTLPVVAQGVQQTAVNEDKFGGMTGGVLDGELKPRDTTGESMGTTSLLWCFLLAFGGGMLLNFMPCVLPVLSLKIMSFVRQAHEDRATIFKLGLAYAAGTLFAFLSLAVLVIALKAGGQAVGWGFQFQHPAFLLAMASLITIMSLGLFGLFDITFQTGVQELDSQARKEGPYGAFFMGILATLLATPCTAPMLGTALGFALSQPAWVILSIFTCIAMGLSAPYLALSAFPSLLRFLPKPGNWMVWLKQGMGAVMLASAGWLLYVLWQGFGNGLGLGGLILCAAVAASTWLVCHFQYGGQRARVLSWLGAGAMCLAAYFLAVQPAMFAKPAVQTQGGELQSEVFSPEALNKHLAQGRVVMIDFTAEWCLTCKVNENMVLSSTDVQKAIKDMNVVVLRADWTNGDERITKLIAKFGRSGVPLYVVFSPDKPNQPIVLPEVITRQIVIDAFKTASGKN